MTNMSRREEYALPGMSLARSIVTVARLGLELAFALRRSGAVWRVPRRA